MTKAWIGACLAAAMASVMHLAPANAQQRECHGGMGTDTQAPRRREAVRLARRINTAQSVASSNQGAYQQLDGLTGIEVPEGFNVQVAASPTSYIFTIKDKQDACGFGLFSDQNGVIYLAETLK